MLLSKKELNKIIQLIPSEDDYMCGVAINCIVFGYHNKQLKVLCIKQEELTKWYLPSGHVKKDEGIHQAASRILVERTGVNNVFLKQFQTFGDDDRIPIDIELTEELNKLPAPIPEKIGWMVNKRFVTICYYALVEFSKVIPRIDFFSSVWTWADVQNLPQMISGNQQMVVEALRTMRRELQYEPIGMNLLPQKFTIAEIQALYETILNKKLDNRNFVKKLVSLEILRKTDEKRSIGGHRSPTLYKFNKQAYTKALKQEFDMIF
ncbi:MAG TPA: NUDIX domain-containing protein [Niabella sp.]|nr:NUDIX domain-containing protein [Niabella sp.]HOZ97839.1 NUDIX domain-containing protein [Niabella sp.]HQW15677.1 NUDIX domain-containing protein [Niabella sp.]HQX20806.1 NUDIX domain-containing protein [Niabella sp.]HQX41390.1 NUDIX domain-containing protein [Niabella sp.]